jgi:DNA modification methylase
VIDQEVEREHDHAKPVAMIAEHMKNWTPHWKLCVDPFLGSGSTLIAAEQLNRKCYGMEISPQYCDVIVARWEKLTGKKAQLDETS